MAPKQRAAQSVLSDVRCGVGELFCYCGVSSDRVRSVYCVAKCGGAMNFRKDIEMKSKTLGFRQYKKELSLKDKHTCAFSGYITK